MTAEGELARRLLTRALDGDRPARLQVQGRCMEPLIQGGDWVDVQPGEPARVGSVVLAREASGELVCHRVLARGKDTLHLAGDRTLALREYPRGDLLGVVRSVERGGATRRLGGWPTPGIDRLLAGLHRLSCRCRGLPAGRAVEALRRRLLGFYGALAPGVPGSAEAAPASEELP